jgi:copper chaperone
MIAFEVNDMTCGHCVGTVTRAVKSVDKDAQVHIDLARHRVEVEPREADAQALRAAIEEAGYTPVVIPG